MTNLDVKTRLETDPFIKYCMKCECSVRAYNAILRNSIYENTDTSDLSIYRGVGLRSGNEIRKLQCAYNNR